VTWLKKRPEKVAAVLNASLTALGALAKGKEDLDRPLRLFFAAFTKQSLDKTFLPKGFPLSKSDLSFKFPVVNQFCSLVSCLSNILGR